MVQLYKSVEICGFFGKNIEAISIVLEIILLMNAFMSEVLSRCIMIWVWNHPLWALNASISERCSGSWLSDCLGRWPPPRERFFPGNAFPFFSSTLLYACQRLRGTSVLTPTGTCSCEPASYHCCSDDRMGKMIFVIFYVLKYSKTPDVRWEWNLQTA